MHGESAVGVSNANADTIRAGSGRDQEARAAEGGV
jgi:hypothetical protein